MRRWWMSLREEPVVVQGAGSGAEGAQNASGAEKAGEPGSSPTWTAKFAPEVREGVKQFKSEEDMARGYIALRTDYSKRKAIPGADAKPEDREAFYNSLGRPEKPEGYGKYAPPKDHPWDEGNEQKFYTSAHKLGLTKDQAKGLMDWYVQSQITDMDGMGRESIKAREDAEKGLRDKWGASYDRNVSLS